MNELPPLLEQIVILIDVPEYDVRAGDLGTVVEIYETPSSALEIEFVNPDGTTRALLTVSPEQVRRITHADIFAIRTARVAA